MIIAPQDALSDIRAERSRRSLRYYLEHVTWPVVEPETPFVTGYHIDAMCEHLEAVTRRQIRNLLITVPPRHTKSITTSVAWPTWSWIDHSESRFLFSSFASDLSTEHAVLSRRVLDSDFYQSRWGDRFQLQTDQNVKTHYENTKRGYRISTSVGGTGTGRGGDFLVIDDPHNLKDIHSDPIRMAVLEWYRTVWSTRFNDPKTGCRVIIMQRGHEEDLAGYVLEQGGFEHLNLPTEYEPTPFVEVHGSTAYLKGHVATAEERSAFEAKQILVHLGKTIRNEVKVSAIGWKDPRTTPGDLLAPDRFGPAEVAQAKRDLLATGFATQHQQRPVPAGGALFKREKLRVITRDELPGDKDFIECRGWDEAATEQEPGKDPDYTVGVKLRYYQKLGMTIVMDVVRGRWDPAPSDDVMRSTAIGDGRKCRQRSEQEPGSAGKKVVAAHVILFRGFDYAAETATGDKTTRAKPFAVQVDNDRVRLLEGEWNDEYIAELILFPNGRHDDQVDATSCAYNDLVLGPKKPRGGTWGR